MIKKHINSCILVFLISVFSHAQSKIPQIPAEWPLHTQNAMNIARDTLLKHLKDYDKRADDFNAKCAGMIAPENKTLIAACQAESDAMDIQAAALTKEKENFLFWFHDNEKIYAAYIASKAFQEKEQEKFDKMRAEWTQAQKQLVQNRLNEPNRLCSGICNALKINEPPLPYKKFDELQSGDVILFSPNLEGGLTIDKITGKIISAADKIVSRSAVTGASHTVTYLKEENGKKLFLDNNPGQGPKIITEEEILLKYADRTAQVASPGSYGVAQPLNNEEAARLYNAAKEMEAKNIAAKIEKAGSLFDKTNYGIFKENIVCSEASWILLKSTGRKMPLSKSWLAKAVGIDFSPSDFYDNSQYFLVTPLSIGSSKRGNE